MSKKRTPSESSNDKQTNEGSDSVFQQDDNAKRAKLISMSDTTLQDLPMELIECILVKAVAMEVEDMHLAKSVWKEKADLVISRLRTVCPQWSSILTTNFFRNELHRTLDGIAQGTIRLEILDQSPLQFSIYDMTTMKDEIFILYWPEMERGYSINVYDRNNLAEVKDVIPLPQIYGIRCMAACSVSNCVYMLIRKRLSHISILRITRDDEHQFHITPLITDVWMPNPNPTLSVAENGSLIVWRQQKDQLPVISIYNANDSVYYQMRMYSDVPKFCDIIPKSNGNLVLVSTNDQKQTALTEIDMDVTIVRQYQSSCSFEGYMCGKVIQAGVYGRLLVNDKLNRIELLDSEFNLLEFSGPQLNARKFIYNSERNEVVTIVYDGVSPHGVLTIFRFTEE